MDARFEKLIGEIGGMTVFELSDFVKAMEEKFGVSAVMPMAAAPAASAGQAVASVAEEKAEFKVTLDNGGDKKIETIKALRKVTTLNLGDAKKAVEEAPTVIAESAPKEEAEKIKKELESVGAKVTLS